MRDPHAPLSVRLSQRHPAAHGLTLVELIIGLSVMSMVLLALTSFMSAVARGWSHSNDAHATGNAAARIGEQVQSTISNMLAVVHSKSGGGAGQNAYLFYWQQDAYTGKADKKAQFGEMALLEYDAAANTLYLYSPKNTSAMTVAERNTAAADDWGTTQADTIVAYYKSSGVAAERVKIAGPDASGNGTEVTSATFELFIPKGAKPMVTYDLNVRESSSALNTDRTYGSATLRSAKTPKNV